MKVLCASIVACALALAAAAPALAGEAQGWQTDSKHIHTVWVGNEFENLAAPRQLPVTTLFHNRNPGDKVTFVRWSDGSNVKQSVSTNFVATGASEESFTVNLKLDPAAFDASGWREVRVTSNVALTDGTREFSTTRWCVFVNNSKPRSDYCGGPAMQGRCGGGAWYTQTQYLVAFVDCRDVQRAATTGFRPGDTIRVKAQHAGSRLLSTWDPAFHSGNPGVGAQNLPGSNTWQRVTVPPLAPGVHKLHLRDNYAGFSGAYVLPVKIV
jgi:hypothetical protein